VDVQDRCDGLAPLLIGNKPTGSGSGVLILRIRVVMLGAEALDFKREDAGPVLPGFPFIPLGRDTSPKPVLSSLPSIHTDRSTAPHGPDPILHFSFDHVE
jgi:hypothetical protein